jgi:hypothetical protein
MGFHLLHEAKPFDDQAVEVMQFLLGELVEVSADPNSPDSSKKPSLQAGWAFEV